MANKIRIITFVIFPLVVIVGILSYQFADNFFVFAEEYPGGTETPPYDPPLEGATSTESTAPPTENSTSTEPTGSGSTATALPLPPLDVRALVASSGIDVKIQWQDVSTNEAEFQVHRRLEGAFWSKIATTPPDRKEFHDLKLLKGKYEYRVYACNVLGCAVGPVIAKVTILQGATSTTESTLESTGDIILTNVRIENVFGRGAQAKWTTTIPSDSSVQYATSSALLTHASSHRCDAGGLVVFHCVNLTNLEYGTVYYVQTRSVGLQGAKGVSLVRSFTTPVKSLFADTYERDAYKMTDVQQLEYKNSLDQITQEAYELQQSIQRLEPESKSILQEQKPVSDIIQRNDTSSVVTEEKDDIAPQKIVDVLERVQIERTFELRKRDSNTANPDHPRHIEFQEHRRKIREQSTSDGVRKESIIQVREILQEISAKDVDLPDSIEDPRQTTEDVLPEVFKVVDIKPQKPIKDDDPIDQQTQPIVLSGVGPPNSVVVLYIFSTPVIVTVHTDENGSWEYNLTRELEDGQHEVHVASVDNSGKILAKSEPLIFFKNTSVAQAAEISFDPPSLLAPAVAEPNFWRANYLWISLGILTLLLLAAIVLMGVLQRKEPK